MQRDQGWAELNGQADMEVCFHPSKGTVYPGVLPFTSCLSTELQAMATQTHNSGAPALQGALGRAEHSRVLEFSLSAQTLEPTSSMVLPTNSWLGLLSTVRAMTGRRTSCLSGIRQHTAPTD